MKNNDSKISLIFAVIGMISGGLIGSYHISSGNR